MVAFTGTPQHMWYKYSDGCCDVFVTDSRTERYIGTSGEHRMLGKKQLSALKRWLGDGSGKVKIVVTSVPFFPDSSSSENEDKWSGFELQRRAIIEHIESKELKKVTFFSGDVHASFSGELILPSGNKIVSVVSSAFFWPYPHPSSSSFRLKGVIDGGGVGDCTLSNFSRVVGDDNFSLVNINPSKISVEVIGRKGKVHHKIEHVF